MIVCVDDDLSVREAIVGFLEAHGYDACAFASAESMLSAGHINDMWCLIADVQLPGMSGLQLQTHLRSISCDIPIIFITAFPDARIRARAQEQGALCFLNKPVQRETLLDCIEEAKIARKRS
jgi:FixJ family two-component response regulator